MVSDYAEVVRAKMRGGVYARDDAARELARRAASRRRVRATKPLECECCGEPFMQKLYVQRYYSRTCQKRAAQRRYRATRYRKTGGQT